MKNFHVTKSRVYYGDTDCGKVVYYANYLKYFEIGRTEMLRDNGIELEEFHKEGVIFVVAEVNVKYRSSAKYNDLLSIKSILNSYTKKTFTIYNEIYNQDSTLLVKGETKCACVSENGKLLNIPVEILKVFSELLKRNE
jgi:acyl-CoA thioester hydrolase